MVYSIYDLTKQLAFGIGVGIGVGIVVSRLTNSKTKQSQREHLIAAISQLANEVKLLREVLLEKGKLKGGSGIDINSIVYSGIATGREIEDAILPIALDIGDDDEEYFEMPPTDTGVTSVESVNNESEYLPGDELKDIISKAESLRSESDVGQQEAYNLLLSTSQTNPANAEIMWRLGRSQYDVAMLKGKEGNQEEKLEWMKKGIESTKQAIQLDEKSSPSHKWYAILIGSYSEFEGTTEKIKSGYTYKEHIDRAIELNPNDPSLYSLLGRWCYEVYLLPWYTRKAAATLYAEPPSATIQDAIKYCLKAEELNPGFWKENMLFIGKCYYQNSEYGKAKEWCLKAKKVPVKTDDDRIAEKGIEELLLKL